MKIKSHILTAYRTISFIGLVSLFVGILWYGLGFILMSGSLTNWAIPIILSPTQERVLAFQPQVATLEASVLRQRVEKDGADAKVVVGQKELTSLDLLLAKIEKAQGAEAVALSFVNKSIAPVVRDKTANIATTDRILLDANVLMKATDDEEAARLITKDQAIARRLQIQQAINQSTDAKAAAITFAEQERQAKAAATTFNGASGSVAALQSLQAQQQIILTRAQLNLDVQTAKATSVAIDTTLSELTRVLDTAKQAPQYRALRETVPVVFAPYDSITSAKSGDPIYDCYITYLICHNVGSVVRVYNAEEYARHPLLKTDVKGHLVEVEFTNQSSAKSSLVFIGRKPLLIL